MNDDYNDLTRIEETWLLLSFKLFVKKDHTFLFCFIFVLFLNKTYFHLAKQY